MKKRKIGLIIATSEGELINATMSGIKARLAGTGIDVYTFLSFPAYGVRDPENFGNYNAFALPNPDDFDGFIFSVNVVQGYEMLETYYSKLLTCDKPKVSLDCEYKGMHSVIPDGYMAEYRIVEHLIKEHGCRDINYVGGSAEHPDNLLRKKAYRDALEANGIKVDERRIRDYWFIDVDGRQAYAEFKEMGLELPDAVVCANDAMALGYCQAAEEDGKYPPDDFLIVGYDNDDNSRGCTPLISTIDKDYFEMGRLGCDVLLRLIAGEEVPTLVSHEQKLVLRGSCGCYAPEELVELDTRQLQRLIHARVKEEVVYYEILNTVRQNLAIADHEGLYNFYLLEIMRNFNIYGYCMCVNQDVYYGTHALELDFQPGFDEKQYVLSGMKHGVSQEEPMIMDTKDYVPEYLQQNDEETHDYLFIPLQKFGVSLGYWVIVDAGAALFRRMVMFLTQGINNAYGNLRNLENLRKVNKRLDSVYVKDALTDMYNRFGYMRDGYEMFEKSKAYGKPLMVMFMDMDRLKEINDIYGHSHGDNALIMFSNVLKRCAGDDKIAVRYGGDEFLIIGNVENEAETEAFKKYLEDELEKENSSSGLEYKIEASIGYVLTDPKNEAELDDYVEEADSLMYEVKKRNRKNRQN